MIYSKQSGEGNVVVLIHGFCETHAIWDTTQLDLASSFHTINIDLPGYGNSDLSAVSITIEEVAKHIVKHLKHLGVDSCVIIGHSLGGYIALAIAEIYPDFLKGFGLFHSTAFADDVEKKKNRIKLIEFIKKYGVSPFISSFVPALFANTNHKSIPDLILNAEKTSKNTALKYTEAMKNRKDRTEILKTFRHPILLIAGTQDLAIPLQDSQEQSKMIDNCYYKELAGVGHMGMIESPQPCLDKMYDFINACY